MRLGLDVTPLLGGPGGVATFVSELAVALVAAPDGPELVPYVLSGRAAAGEVEAAAAGALGGAAARRLPLPAVVARPLWRTLGHPVAERWLGAVDLVHGTNFVVPPTRAAARVVTVHDLSFVHEAAEIRGELVSFDRDVRAAAARGATLHVPSRAVAAEVRARYPGADVAVVAEGVRLPTGAPAPDGDGDPPTVLALGRSESRKQLDWLVRAFGLVARDRPDVRLVVAGPRGSAEHRVAAAIAALPGSVAGRVERVAAPSDARRDALYRRATVFVHPARYEGFGLPLLEAMAHGVAVLAAASPAAVEVAGEAARLVAPDGSDEDLAAALDGLLVDGSTRRALVRRGTARAAGYTWRRTAEEMLALYHRVLGRT